MAKENPRAKIEVEHVIPVALSRKFPASRSLVSSPCTIIQTTILFPLLFFGAVHPAVSLRYSSFHGFTFQGICRGSIRLSIWLVSDNPQDNQGRTLKAIYQSRIFFLFETIRKVSLCSNQVSVTFSELPSQLQNLQREWFFFFQSSAFMHAQGGRWPARDKSRVYLRTPDSPYLHVKRQRKARNPSPEMSTLGSKLCFDGCGGFCAASSSEGFIQTTEA
jgi:hypothetical protein